jgi:hypothetical protein
MAVGVATPPWSSALAPAVGSDGRWRNRPSELDLLVAGTALALTRAWVSHVPERGITRVVPIPPRSPSPTIRDVALLMSSGWPALDCRVTSPRRRSFGTPPAVVRWTPRIVDARAAEPPSTPHCSPGATSSRVALASWLVSRESHLGFPHSGEPLELVNCVGIVVERAREHVVGELLTRPLAVILGDPAQEESLRRRQRSNADRTEWCHRSTPATRVHRGSAARTRTPTGFCATTSQRTPTSASTRWSISSRSRTNSTIDPPSPRRPPTGRPLRRTVSSPDQSALRRRLETAPSIRGQFSPVADTPNVSTEMRGCSGRHVHRSARGLRLLHRRRRATRR